MFYEDRRRLGGWALLWVFLILLVVELCGCSPAPLVLNGTIDQSAVDQIKREVEKARGLRFQQDVQVRVVTLAVARDAFENMLLQASGDKSTLQAATNAWRRLHALLPFPPQYGPDDILNALGSMSIDIIALQTSPTEILVVEGGAERLISLSPLRPKIANALRHPIYFITGRGRYEPLGLTEYDVACKLDAALIDQNFGFAGKFLKLHDNDDAEIALRYVQTADPIMTANIVVPNGSYWSLPVCSSMSEGFWARPAGWWYSFSAGFPPGVGESLITLVDSAAVFACEAYRKKGWSSMNELYGNLPKATQQLMHPELYFEHYTQPHKITLPGYQLPLIDWTPVYQGTYGEWGLKYVLEDALGRDSPDVVLSAQWAGDRVLALQEGQELSVVWLITFRDVSSASRFNKLYGKPQALQLIRTLAQGDRVLVVVGEAAKRFDLLAPSVLKESRDLQE